MEKFLTTAQVQEIFGIGRQALYFYRKRGLVPFYKLNERRIMYKASDIENFLESCRVEPLK